MVVILILKKNAFAIEGMKDWPLESRKRERFTEPHSEKI